MIDDVHGRRLPVDVRPVDLEVNVERRSRPPERIHQLDAATHAGEQNIYLRSWRPGVDAFPTWRHIDPTHRTAGFQPATIPSKTRPQGSVSDHPRTRERAYLISTTRPGTGHRHETPTQPAPLRPGLHQGGLFGPARRLIIGNPAVRCQQCTREDSRISGSRISGFSHQRILAPACVYTIGRPNVASTNARIRIKCPSDGLARGLGTWPESTVVEAFSVCEGDHRWL